MKNFRLWTSNLGVVRIGKVIGFLPVGFSHGIHNRVLAAGAAQMTDQTEEDVAEAQAHEGDFFVKHDHTG